MIIVPEIWITKDYFCPFNPSPQQQGKSKFWKNEKNAWRYYHFTRVYHKWKSNDVWLLRYEMWQNFLLFWATFCPFTPLTKKKIKILRKWKKQLEILSFYTHVSKIMITCYTIPEIWHMTDIIYISYFGPFSAILPPKSPKKQNFKKWKKTPGDIIILQMCTKNYDHMMYGSWDMVWDGWMDQQTDRKTDM